MKKRSEKEQKRISVTVTSLPNDEHLVENFFYNLKQLPNEIKKKVNPKISATSKTHISFGRIEDTDLFDDYLFPQIIEVPVTYFKNPERGGFKKIRVDEVIQFIQLSFLYFID